MNAPALGAFNGLYDVLNLVREHALEPLFAVNSIEVARVDLYSFWRKDGAECVRVVVKAHANGLHERKHLEKLRRLHDVAERKPRRAGQLLKHMRGSRKDFLEQRSAFYPVEAVVKLVFPHARGILFPSGRMSDSRGLCRGVHAAVFFIHEPRSVEAGKDAAFLLAFRHAPDAPLADNLKLQALLYLNVAVVKDDVVCCARSRIAHAGKARLFQEGACAFFAAQVPCKLMVQAASAFKGAPLVKHFQPALPHGAGEEPFLPVGNRLLPVQIPVVRNFHSVEVAGVLDVAFRHAFELPQPFCRMLLLLASFGQPIDQNFLTPDEPFARRLEIVSRAQGLVVNVVCVAAVILVLPPLLARLLIGIIPCDILTAGKVRAPSERHRAFARISVCGSVEAAEDCAAPVIGCLEGHLLPAVFIACAIMTDFAPIKMNALFFPPHGFLGFCKNVVVKLHKALVHFGDVLAYLDVLPHAVVRAAHVAGERLEYRLLVVRRHFARLVLQEILEAVGERLRARVGMAVLERIDAFLPVAVLNLKRLLRIIFKRAGKLRLPYVRKLVAPRGKVGGLRRVDYRPHVPPEAVYRHRAVDFNALLMSRVLRPPIITEHAVRKCVAHVVRKRLSERGGARLKDCYGAGALSVGKVWHVRLYVARELDADSLIFRDIQLLLFPAINHDLPRALPPDKQRAVPYRLHRFFCGQPSAVFGTFHVWQLRHLTNVYKSLIVMIGRKLGFPRRYQR